MEFESLIGHNFFIVVSCPPAKKRDFVVQSSWLQNPKESIIINHSVFHKNTPPAKGYIRATSYFTGMLIIPTNYSIIRVNSNRMKNFQKC